MLWPYVQLGGDGDGGQMESGGHPSLFSVLCLTDSIRYPLIVIERDFFPVVSLPFTMQDNVIGRKRTYFSYFTSAQSLRAQCDSDLHASYVVLAHDILSCRCFAN